MENNNCAKFCLFFLTFLKFLLFLVKYWILFIIFAHFMPLFDSNSCKMGDGNGAERGANDNKGPWPELNQ